MRVLLLLAMFACTKAEPAEQKPVKREPPPVQPVKQQPAWQDAMAKTIVAALVANDYELLPKLPPKLAAQVGADVSLDGFRALHEKLTEAKIDLAKATIAKVDLERDPTGVDVMHGVTVTMAYEGRRFEFHFTVVMFDGKPALAGTSYWFQWLP
jgi:hypothetical protein